MEEQSIANGGMQYVPQIAVQYVYLDFDGELTSYNGEILTVDGVEVIDPKLTAERIANIVAKLNEKYASQNVIFLTERPETAEYSTIFIGKTSAFSSYGNFSGLAETIDFNNQNKTDKAFVMLDSTATDIEIISTISHETDHLLGTLNHGGEGLAQYAATLAVTSGQTANGVIISAGDTITVYNGGTAANTTIHSNGSMCISNGGIANNTDNSGYISISSGGTANDTVLYENGKMHISYGGVANSITINENTVSVYTKELHISSGGVANYTVTKGDVFVSSGGVVNDTVIKIYGIVKVFNGGTANRTIMSDGYMDVFSGGVASRTEVNASAKMYVSDGGVANSTTVNSKGRMTVSSGGVARSNTVTYAGDIFVFSGGVASSTTVVGGDMYIEYGGAAEGVTINSSGYLWVAQKGAARDIVIDSGGSMTLSTEAEADSIIVSSGGYLALDGRTSVSNITVKAGATLVDYGALFWGGTNIFGGTITLKSSVSASDADIVFDLQGRKTTDSFIINDISLIEPKSFSVSAAASQAAGTYKLAGNAANFDGIISVSGKELSVGGGGVVIGDKEYTIAVSNAILTLTIGNAPLADDQVKVYSSGTLVKQGTVLTGETIAGGANNSMCIFSGGVASNTTVNSYGYMYISSGGTANSTTVNSYGYIYIFSVGVASNTTVNSYGRMYISSGGVANSTIVNSYGSMYISSGVVANSTTMNGGYMCISSGGTANNNIVSSGGRMYVFSGGVASNTTVNTYGGIWIFSGGVANSTTVNSYGSMYISSGVVANSTTMNGGYMCISSGGTANNNIVSSGGRMHISSGGVARSNTVTYAGDIFVFSGGVASSTTVAGGDMYIKYGGTANNNIVSSGGGMHISGVANSTTISDCYIYIDGGGVANNTTMNGGYMCISSGGVANGVIVDLKGSMCIRNGGKAENLTVKAGVVFNSFSFAEDKYFVQINGPIEIFSNVSIIDNRMIVSSGGTATRTTVNSNGQMIISSGGVANSTTVNSYGSMRIDSGGTATVVFNPWQGKIFSSAGAVITYLERDANIYFGYYGNFLSKTNDELTNHTIFKYNDVEIYSGGAVSNTTVNSGGSMYINSGAVHRGSLQITPGAGVTAYSGAKIDFTVSGRTVEDDYLINDLSLISGAPGYTITVSTAQAVGTYKLAQGAADFAATVSIGNGTLNYGTLTANGDDLIFNGMIFQLDKTDGNLSLTIDVLDTTPPTLTVSGNAVGWTNQDVVLTATADEEALIEYFDGRSWVAGDTITVIENGSYSFRATDAAGNVTEKSVVVDKIDKVPPTLTVSGNAAEWTNQDVILTATVSDGTVEYFNGTEWVAGNSMTAAENGTYFFRATDVVGNTTETLVEVNKIDKVSPILSIVSDNTDPYASKVTLTAKITEDNLSSVVYSYDNKNWHIYTAPLAVTSNQSIYFQATDMAGNSTSASCDITNIGLPVKLYSFGQLVSKAIKMTGVTISSEGLMLISSGGTAISTTICYGDMYIYLGGVANRTTVNSYGLMYISSGGTANSTTVNSDGLMCISSGGIANSTIVNSRGYMHVSSGGTATVVFNPWQGTIDSSAGAVVTYLERNANIYYGNGESGIISKYNSISYFNVNSGNTVIIYSGGIANSTTIDSGNMYISSGGVACNTTVNSCGYIRISGGGVASNTTVNSYGSIGIFSGGAANSTIVNGGNMFIFSSGGVASNTTVNSYGSIWIFSGGVANSTTVNYRGDMALSGGVANHTTVKSNGSIRVYSGGVANSTTVCLYGYMYISSGGVANSTIVNSSGYMRVSSGGAANDTIVSNGGQMYIYNGGAANSTMLNGGHMRVFNGGSASSTVVRSDYMCISGGGFADEVTVYGGGVVWIYGEEYAPTKDDYPEPLHAVATDVDVYSGGTVVISGGSVTNLMVYSGGVASVSGVSDISFVDVTASVSCGEVRYGGSLAIGWSGVEFYGPTIFGGSITVDGWANLYGETSFDISERSAADTYIVDDISGLYLSDIGFYSIIVSVDQEFGTYKLAGNAANFNKTISVGSNALTVGGAGVVVDDKKYTLSVENSILTLTVGDATPIGDQVKVYSSGTLVKQGTVLTGETIAGGANNSMYVSSGGTANSTTVDSRGNMYISGGGFADEVTVYGGGVVWIYGEEYAPTKDDYPEPLHAVATDVDVYSGGTAVISGGSVTDLMVYSGGVASVSGVSDISFVDVTASVSCGEVRYGGSLTIGWSGVEFYGPTIFGGSITVDGWANLYGETSFDISERSAADTYIVDDISGLYLSDIGFYSIIVSAEQEFGTYKLAQGAANFAGTVFIGNSSVNYGSITVNGDDLLFEGVAYSLDKVDGNLTLTIAKSQTVSNLQGNQNGVSWNGSCDAYTVSYSKDNFATGLQFNTTTSAVDTYGMPGGTYQWKVAADGEEYKGNDIVSNNSSSAQKFISDADGNMDLFFGKANGVWGIAYSAQNAETGEVVSLNRKNRIQDVFSGSTDANILVLTDDANGDALFIDDVYSALGTQARLSQIDEIRAGAGNDIVDLTSNKYAFAGDKLTIYGGAGDDTIWANTEDDCIIGGSGNDSLFGGGGNDTFIFGANWGNDTVEQLASGKVTLHFESGSESNWNAATGVYSDGVNSVTVTGTSDITLKFGEDASLPAGVFTDAVNEKIFEDKNKAMLA